MKLAILAFDVLLLLQRCDASYWHRKSIKAPMNSQTGQTLVFDRRTFTHPKVLYAICLAGGDSRHKNCTVRRFRHVYGKEQDKVYACNVTIQAKMSGSAIGDKVRLAPLAEDRAIFAYLEITDVDAYLGLISVRLPDCKVHELAEVYRVDPDIGNTPYELELLALPGNGSAYQAIYRDSRKCGDEYCRLRVDPRGDYSVKPGRWLDTGFDRQRQVVELVPFAAKFYRFLMLEFGYGKSQFSLINEHNEVKVLDVQKRHKNESSYKTTWTLAYTTANERSGICHLLDSTLNCAQYDESGVQVYRTKQHNFNQYDDAWIAAMHNLPAGNGILVLLVEHVPNRYRLLRFNQFGKKVGYLHVTRFDCDWRENAIAGQFFEADNEYCVSLACYDTAEFSQSKRDRGNIDVVTERFSLDEFETLSNDD